MLVRGLALGGFCSLFTLLAADPPAELASSPHPKGYVCHRTPQAIVIDGKMDEAWSAAAWTDHFVDIEGDRKPAPRHKTRVKMLWDDDAIYILAELEDPHVWGTLREHDSVIFHDNDFEVFLDPNGDNHVYGELEVNALNTTWDLLLTKPYKDGGRAIDSWEIKGLQTGVHVNGTVNDPSDTDRGWTLEIRWPFANISELAKLQIPPRDGDQWRINFSRVQWQHEVVAGKYRKVKGTKEDNWVWSPQGVIDMHRPEKWGYLQFSTAKPGQAEFRSDPDWPTRDVLHRLYYAQRAHFRDKGKYAEELGPLNLRGIAVPLAGGVQIETTRSTFEASLDRPGEPGIKARRSTITSDGRFRSTEQE
jgi:hypothetical protein